MYTEVIAPRRFYPLSLLFSGPILTLAAWSKPAFEDRSPIPSSPTLAYRFPLILCENHLSLLFFAREPPMADYDSPWKEALDYFFEDFLQLFFPETHADIDGSRPCESLDKELQKIAPEADIGRRYVDKLVKVWLKSGQEQWVLIHIEVQMSDEADFPWRMYVYHCRIFIRYNKNVASFAVLGDDNPHWRPQGYGYQLWGTEAGLRFPMVKLLDYAAKRSELEESCNPFATVVSAHLDTQETRQDLGQRKERKFGLVKRLRRRGWSETQARRLFKLIDWLMELPQPLADEFWNELKQHEEKEHMPFITTPERYGRIEGLTQGLNQGLTQARLEDIEAIVRHRFPDASSQLLSEIRQIQDHEQLKKVLLAAATVADPDELRKVWMNGANR